MDRHAIDCLSTFKAAVPCKADAAPSVLPPLPFLFI